jgi:tRNA-dihydrouridine synthase B
MIGLAPMDGISDAAYRQIADIYGKPDILITEFVAVEGLTRNAVGLLHHFLKHKTTTPTIGQIYGAEVSSFYPATILLAELGFDGVDINMGCPDKSVVKRGAGAGLIRTPEIAKQIIKEAQRGVVDWSNGQTLKGAGFSDKFISEVNRIKVDEPVRKLLPVSVKTRIGYDEITTTEWIPHLIETRPARISIHGRTLKQMYSGFANWEEIGKATELSHKANIPLFGNGDVKNKEGAIEKMKEYGVDGILIGRATFGNPWALCGHIPTKMERLEVAIKHSDLFTKYFPTGNFHSLRKHLTWYTSSFANASKLRMELVKVESVKDVKQVISSFLKENPSELETDLDDIEKSV